jgi:hypothetical protein
LHRRQKKWAAFSIPPVSQQEQKENTPKTAVEAGCRRPRSDRVKANTDAGGRRTNTAGRCLRKVVRQPEAAVFDKEKRIEDNETLKRALHLAETGLYLSCRDIERELARQQYPRVSQVLDPAMRKRIDKICSARRTR